MEDAPPCEICQSDTMDPARATALGVTLGLDSQFSPGDVLPPFFHQIYFWEPRPADDLGRDGHPRVGGLIPDMGLPRRMWAGGTLEFHRPLRTGVPALKRSIRENAVRKQGRSGPLGLVTLRHEIHQGNALCITDRQDLVYRPEPQAHSRAPAAPIAPDDEEVTAEIAFTTTQLFRYSALTFNGHRIHYDLPYARSVEGYAGLVVHGPLLAQYLMLMAQRDLGPLRRFSFRATAPLMDFETATLCRRGSRLWVRGPQGRQCMTAEAAAHSE